MASPSTVVGVLGAGSVGLMLAGRLAHSGAASSIVLLLRSRRRAVSAREAAAIDMPPRRTMDIPSVDRGTIKACGSLDVTLDERWSGSPAWTVRILTAALDDPMEDGPGWGSSPVSAASTSSASPASTSASTSLPSTSTSPTSASTVLPSTSPASTPFPSTSPASTALPSTSPASTTLPSTSSASLRASTSSASLRASTSSSADLLDVLFVTTKAGDAVGAVAEAAARRWVAAGRTVLVPMTNGLGVAEALQARFPAQPLLVASTTHGATRTGTAAVAHTGRGTTWVGFARDRGAATDAQLAEVVRMLDVAGLDAVVEVDMPRRLWIKAAVSCCLNGPAALLYCRNGALADGAAAATLRRAVCADIAPLLPHEGAGAIPAADLEHAAHEVARKTSANVNSMLQDVAAGRPTEADAIYGHIVRRAQVHGLAVPTVAFLHTLIGLREHGRSTEALAALDRDLAALAPSDRPDAVVILDALRVGVPVAASDLAALARAVRVSGAPPALACLLALAQLRADFGPSRGPADPYSASPP